MAKRSAKKAKKTKSSKPKKKRQEDGFTIWIKDRKKKELEAIKESSKPIKNRTFSKVILCILSYLVVFWIGQFANDYAPLRDLNPIIYFVGDKDVTIEPSILPTLSGNKTSLFFELKNTGLKNIDYLEIRYSFCGAEEGDALLRYRKVDVGEKREFSINISAPVNMDCLNKDSSFSVPELYIDSNGKMYCDSVNGVIPRCLTCNVLFNITDEGDSIKENYEVVYPVPVEDKWYVNLTSNCFPIPNDKTGLRELEAPKIWLVDRFSFCMKRHSPAWCERELVKVS